VKRNAAECVLCWPDQVYSGAAPAFGAALGCSYKELAEALNVKMSGIGTMLKPCRRRNFRNRYLALHPNEAEI